MVEDVQYDLTPAETEALLKRIRDRYDDWVVRNQEIIAQGDRDMRALSVDGDWPEEEKKARKKAKRPMGHTDIISPNNDRVINQFNMHPRGIKIVETGEESTEETATRRESRIRQIEHENDAVDAYGTMIQNAVDRGVGIVKLSTERISRKSKNLRFCIEAVANVKSCVWDPDTRKKNRSDMRGFFHIDKEYTEDEFKLTFGDEARFVSFSDEHRRIAPKWIGDKKIRVAQYYERTEGEEDQPDVVKIYLTNGVDILGKPGKKYSKWVGSTIPFGICTGREKWEDDELVIESMTRKMRHPSMMYDFADASEREAFGTMIKAKVLTAEGQVEDFPEWKDPFRANRVNLRYKDFIQGRAVAPPILIQTSPQLEPFQIAKQSYLRAGQNAIGMSSTDQKDRISKSGVAQERIDQAGDIASFHFVNSANRTIRYVLQMINEGLEVVEDSSRSVGLRKNDGSYEKFALKVIEGQPHPYGLGEDHGLIIETGPGYQSDSDKADAFLSDFGRNAPELIPRYADQLVLNARIGPRGQVIAERVKPVDVAQREEAEKNGQQPLPPQVQQQIAMLGQQNKELMLMVKQQAQVIDAKMIETNAKQETEIKKAEFDFELAKFTKFMDYKIALTKVNATAASDAEYQENEANLAAEQHRHEIEMSAIEHARGQQNTAAGQEHEIGMTTLNQGHEAEMAAQSAANQNGNGAQP